MQLWMITDGEFGAAALHHFHRALRREAALPRAIGSKIFEILCRVLEVGERNARGQERADAGLLKRKDVCVLVPDYGGCGRVCMCTVRHERKIVDLPLLWIAARPGDACEIGAAGLKTHTLQSAAWRIAQA